MGCGGGGRGGQLFLDGHGASPRSEAQFYGGDAGRYIGNGIYLGAKQGTTGGQTRATVQIDITKGLKLETELGTGTGGNSVGLLYQFEY